MLWKDREPGMRKRDFYIAAEHEIDEPLREIRILRRGA
jgi:hypothetical protein